jgi:hypothetical protein
MQAIHLSANGEGGGRGVGVGGVRGGVKLWAKYFVIAKLQSLIFTKVSAIFMNLSLKRIIS